MKLYFCLLCAVVYYLEDQDRVPRKHKCTNRACVDSGLDLALIDDLKF